MCVCVWTGEWVGGWRANCVWICKNPKQRSWDRNPNSISCGWETKKSKGQLTSLGISCSSSQISVCLSVWEGGRERARECVVCTGDSSFYHHHYDHFITGFQQPINHNNTKHTNQKASVMFFLSFSLSLSLSRIEKCQSVGQPLTLVNQKKNSQEKQ
jgi:hypothetical protein